MNLEEITQETFLEKLRRKTRKLVLPLALTSSILTFKCNCDSPTEPKKEKQEIVQLDSLTTTTKTNEQGIINLQDPETNKISTLKVKDKETQLPLQNINIACYNNKEENIQTVIAQDSLGVYFSNIKYFLPQIAKIAEMPNYYEMLLEKDLSKPFIHFELEIPEYIPKNNKTFLGTTTLRDLHKFYEEHDTLFNNADIIEFYFTVLGVKNHPAAVFATRLNEARSNFIENMATFTEIKNIILGFTGSEQDPDAEYWDVYKSNIANFGVVQHELNNTGLCTLKGKLLDKNTKKPLEAIITVDSKKDTSDVNGDYMITFIQEGDYKISCSKDGFETASLDTLIKAAKYPSFVSTKKDFELEEEIIDNRIDFIVFTKITKGNNYEKKYSINIIDPQSGKDKELISSKEFKLAYPIWSKDKKNIFFAKNVRSYWEKPHNSKFGLYIMDSNGENEKQILDMRDPRINESYTVNEIRGISCFPNGSKLAVCFSEVYSSYNIYFVSLEGSEVQYFTYGIYPSISPDGNKIAYGNTFYQIYLEDIFTREKEYFDRGEHPAWSPTGQELLYDNNPRLKITNIFTKESRAITDNYIGWYATWSSSGDKIVFDNEKQIFIMDIINLNSTQISDYDNSISIRYPCWSRK